MFFKPTVVFISLAAIGVQAICPGFNYGIGNVRSLGGNINRWDVFDDACNIVDGLTTSLNPCTTAGIFVCSPPPIIFTQYKNTFTGLIYACRPDPNSGSCGGTMVSVCCRNDGN